MRRKYQFASLAILTLAVTALALVWTLTRSSADQAEPQAAAGKTVPLPVAQVILFNSGVGYFERQGQVSGDTRVELSFPTSDVNDLLKSLVLQDTAGGRVEAISYDSQDPVDKILRSFALDLNNNPTYAQILNQARGEKIEVMRQEKPGANPHKLTGTIVGMEVHRQIAGKDAYIDVEQLNLLTGEGMLSIPLTQVLSVRFQNQTLENEFKRALQVLAGSHDVQKKTVSLHFSGNGKRAVKVGYVVERPIWKTTYRLVLEPNGKLFMQGWAIVENTSDDDWNNVRMVLVSGKPISYRMDLYEPLYIPRPLVEPELFASLRPPVYGGSIYDPSNLTTKTGQESSRGGGGTLMGGGGLPGFPGAGGGGGGIGGGAGKGVATAKNAGISNMLLDSEQVWNTISKGYDIALIANSGMLKPYLEEFAAANGMTNGYITKNEFIGFAQLMTNKLATSNLGGLGAGVDAKSPRLPAGAQPVPELGAVIIRSQNNQDQQQLQQAIDAIQGRSNKDGQSKLNYDDMMKRKELQRILNEEGKRMGSTIAGLNYKEGIQSLASSEEIGDYYQYVIDQKISLARQKSAMLPILNQTIEGAKISIYNEAVHAKFPLLGIRLKNTSGKPLTQGPITVYDDGSYAGDTRTLDLQPNEERLLSYAIDQGTEVKTEVKTHPAPEMTFNIGGNNLTAVYTMRQTKTYTIKNRSTHDRTVVIEHPIRGDWKLVDAKAPSDRSRDVYRFQIEVKAGKTATQDVLEEQQRTDPVALSGGKDIAPRYAVFSGIEVKPETKTERAKLLSLSINKGVLVATYKERDSKTYFIQNQSERDHSFTVDHVIRKDWKRLAKDGKDQDGPAVYQFKVEVKSKGTAHQEVVEERVYQDRSQVVAKLDDSELRRFIADAAPAANVKAALQQVLDKQAAVRSQTLELTDKKVALKLLTDDQARVRDNLKIIPQTSEHYKDFLKKFVEQEAQIDESQRSIRGQEAQMQKLQKDYEMFVNGLTVQ